MALLTRLKSLIRGLLWNFRSTGLRARLDQIDERLRQIDDRATAKDPTENFSLNTRERIEFLVSRSNRLDFICSKLDDVANLARGMETRVLETAALRIDEEIRKRQAERWRLVGDLRGFERKIFSQNGEDGILKEIFHRIGIKHRYFVEFGVESGAECNSLFLAQELKWSGMFMESGENMFVHLQERYKDRPDVRCVCAPVTSKNIEQLLEENNVPRDFDLLSIDIDSNDYWVWKAVVNWQPRVVVIEFNAFHVPPKKWVLKENLQYSWNGTTYFGASLASLAALGEQKGYTLACTDSRGVNAFFVRTDCMPPGKFLDPVLHYHYTPFGYSPPPTGDGPFEEI